MRQAASQYLMLRAIGAPAVVVALAIQGVFRGFKDTKTPLYVTSKWAFVLLQLPTFCEAYVLNIGFEGMRVLCTVSTPAYCPLLIAVAGNLVNIILDPILIFTLNLGVRGAAIATIISQ